MKQILTLALVLSTFYSYSQSNYITTGQSSGEWNDAKTWELAPGSVADSDNDGIPDANDHVTVLSGHSLVVRNSYVCKSLLLEDKGDLTELIISGGANLDILGNFNISSSLKLSEIIIDIKGSLNAKQTTVDSYGADDNIELNIGKAGSFMVAAHNITSLTQLAQR